MINSVDRSRKSAWIALLLLVPSPSIGVLAGLILFPDTSLGQGVFLFTKAWMLLLPAVWIRFVERRKFSLSPSRKGGFGIGVASGLFISVAIAGLYWWLGSAMLDKALFVDRLTKAGLANKGLYFGAMVYWVLVNSVLEEYVWRWFCVEQCERLWPRGVAVVASAICFTIHHVLAMSVYFPPIAVVLCSIGVFIGGLLWSAMYVRYASIWPGYVSHAIVNVAVFGVGAAVLFG